VPLDMQIDRQRRIHHVTASLFDRSCQRQETPANRGRKTARLRRAPVRHTGTAPPGR
jgi:hypothetical protein